MKNIFKNIKNYFKDNKTKSITILVVLILTIISSITLIAYSFYQNKSTKLIISGLALIDSSDVSIKVYRENKNDNGVGLGTYALSYYVPSATSYTYQSSKTVCDTGITIEKYENQKFYVDATKKGKCKVYFDAIDGYIDDYEVNLFVQQEVGNTDDKNYNPMGQLPLYETGYYYTINTNKTSCTNGATVSIVGRNIVVLTTQKAVCNVYADKNSDSVAPTISEVNVSSKTISATLDDNVKLSSYGISSSSTLEPEEWIDIPTTPYVLNTDVDMDGTYYLWVKDTANNTKLSDTINIVLDSEKPLISNLSINEMNLSALLSDNVGLSKYGISTSSTMSPTSWTTISGTSYNLNYTFSNYGNYYLYVYDVNGNVQISKMITITEVGYEMILLNNGNGTTNVSDAKSYIVNKGTPTFTDVATTNEGMYATEDDYTATTGMKSYYFRGAVNNNWVKFGKEGNKDIYWRIIRINGDGSIRMIYSGTTAPTSSTATVMTGTGTQINATTYAYNSSSNNPAYVGYIYTASQQHGNSTSSTIKTTLENWYKTTTLEKDEATKALVSQDQIFCNDRSVTSGSFSTSSTFYYATYTRLKKNKKPILTCPTESDKFTSKKSNKGNKKLDYPVGLITADEVLMAGGVYGGNNKTYYLYTNQNYWSGSPNIFNGSVTKAYVIYVNSSGLIGSHVVNGSNGARPVVSLSSKAKLSGNGTYSNPYTVS